MKKAPGSKSVLLHLVATISMMFLSDLGNIENKCFFVSLSVVLSNGLVLQTKK